MRNSALTFIFLWSFLPAFSQYFFTGRVVDQFNHPVQGVSIWYNGTQLGQTDSIGDFKVNNTDSIANLAFSRDGFISKAFLCKANRALLVVLDRDISLLDEATVRAFEMNTTLNSVAASVSIISKASINRFPSQSFVSAFNSVPGVKMDQRSPGSYRLNIRGNLLRSTFGVRNVKVYWNGIPFTDATGTTYLNELSPSNIDKIEIIKGPSGSMYGAGTGGVVLLNSSAVSSPMKRLTIESSGGSYSTYSTNASIEANGKASQLFSYSHAQTGGYRDQSGMRRDAGNYVLRVPVSSSSRLNSNVLYSDLYYQTPGGLTMSEMKKNPSGARPAAGVFPGATAQKASLHLKTLYTGLGYESKFGAHWNASTGIYGSYTDFSNPTIRNFEKKFEKGIGGRAVVQFRNGRLTQSIGGEFQAGSINTNVFGNRFGTPDTLQYHDIIDAKQANIFLQTAVNVLSNFSVEAGLSYNKFFYGFSRVNLPSSLKSSSGFKAQVIPRLTALLNVGRVNFYFVASRGYSPPSIDEIHASNGFFNKALAAETSINYEAGMKGILVKNKLWVDMSYYLFNLKNTIVSRRDSSGADYYVNAGKTNQHGFEAAIKYHPFVNTKGVIRELTGWLNITKTTAHFRQYQQGVNKFDGNYLTGTPGFVFGAGFGLKFPLMIYLNSNFNYTSKIPLNDANSFFSERYNLLNLKLGKNARVSKATDLDVYFAYECSSNNPFSLGNDLNAAGDRYFNPSAPNNFTIGAKLMFNLKLMSVEAK